MQLIGRLTIVLWLFVCISAVSVVYSNYRARALFNEWQTSLKAQQQYEVEWGQLLIEKSALATYARLERLAAEKLSMVVPKVQQMQIIKEAK